MARMNDVAIGAALQAITQVVKHQPNGGSLVLETFYRNDLPIFKGRFNPDGAQVCIKEIERIFQVMDFS